MTFDESPFNYIDFYSAKNEIKLRSLILKTLNLMRYSKEP